VVRNFIELKARLTWNGIRKDVQRRFGFPLATVLLAWVAIWLAGKHLAIANELATSDVVAFESYMGWTALFFFLVWITLPVIIFPLDENLDPQQLAVLPISGNQMVRGLTAASLVAPAIIVPLVLLGANASLLSSGWWMALPASLVYIGLLMVGAQLFSASVSAILRTRRGRDIATFLVLGLAAGSFFIYRAVSRTVDSLGMAQAVLNNPIMDWAVLVPPVAAQRAITDAAGGNTVSALFFLTISVGWLLGLAYLWKRLLEWMLTTPAEGSRPAARARRHGMATGA